MRQAWKDPELRERYFITPLAVSAVSSAPRARSRSPRGQRAQAPNGKGAGKGKNRHRGTGKGAGTGGQKDNNKNSGKGGSKDWHSSTPDGRAICYAYNNAGESCAGQCNRLRVCRRCFGTHPVHLCTKRAGK